MSAPVNRSFDHKLIGKVNRGLLYAIVDWPYVTISDFHRLLLFLEELLFTFAQNDPPVCTRCRINYMLKESEISHVNDFFSTKLLLSIVYFTRC